jgi:hypothetical protein
MPEAGGEVEALGAKGLRAHSTEVDEEQRPQVAGHHEYGGHGSKGVDGEAAGEWTAADALGYSKMLALPGMFHTRAGGSTP